MFGLVLGATAAIGVALGWTEPYWVPEPVLILVLYIIMGKRDRIRGKALGTALGIAAAIPVAIISPPPAVLTTIGIIAFIIALTQAKTYWLMYGLYTFSLVLLLSAPGKVGFEAEERGVEILVGIGLLVVGLAVVHARPLAGKTPPANRTCHRGLTEPQHPPEADGGRFVISPGQSDGLHLDCADSGGHRPVHAPLGRAEPGHLTDQRHARQP